MITTKIEHIHGLLKTVKEIEEAIKLIKRYEGVVPKVASAHQISLFFTLLADDEFSLFQLKTGIYCPIELVKQYAKFKVQSLAQREDCSNEQYIWVLIFEAIS